MIALHVVPQFLLEQQTGHLYALRTVKAGVRLILILLLLLGSRRLLIPSYLVLGEEEACVHLFFSELEAILKGLRTGRPVGRMAAIAPIRILLQLVLVLVLLEDAEKLKLLPQLLLEGYDVRGRRLFA